MDTETLPVSPSTGGWCAIYTRAWLSAERPIVLFDLATARLIERRIVLPGVTTLARLVATVRDRAAERLWRTLAELPNRTQRKRLETLLLIPESSRVSLLDRLRKAPVHISAPGWWRHCSGSTSFAGWVWEA
jgi:hypothetical protein